MTHTRETMPDETSLAALASSLDGTLLRPGDDGYHAGRGVWNARVDRSPALIVRAAHAADVVHAVKFAREHGLPVAVRSGGHSFAGHSTADGGLVIDLSLMKAIHLDPARQMARIEPGLTWGEVAQQTHAHGLALTSGDRASVGVGGLILGGGIGWMVRKHGLTIDHVRSIDLVTADGHPLTASAEHHPELFWGLRGGGGNFGIATAFEVGLHPAGLVLGGAVCYDAADAQAILRAYAQYALHAPDELTTIATLMVAPPAPFIPPSRHGSLVVMILVCYAGALEEGGRVVAPLRRLGTPLADVIGPMPYPALFELTKEGSVPGLQHQARSMLLERLDQDVLHTIVGQAVTISGPGQMAHLRILGGAMSRVGAHETAFSHRDKPAMFTIINSWQQPAKAAERHTWTERFWSAMRSYASGVYVNFLGDEGEERIRAAYSPSTYRRLAALKAQYDPTNCFRLNQNITPAVQHEAQHAA